MIEKELPTPMNRPGPKINLEHIIPNPESFFSSFQTIYEGLAEHDKQIYEESPDGSTHTALTKSGPNRIRISRTKMKRIGTNEHMVVQYATVMKGKHRPFYSIQVQSGFSDALSTSEVHGSINDEYAKTQIGLLLTTTQQAYERQKAKEEIISFPNGEVEVFSADNTNNI